jgi:hypothetical protein
MQQFRADDATDEDIAELDALRREFDDERRRARELEASPDVEDTGEAERVHARSRHIRQRMIAIEERLHCDFQDGKPEY